MRTRPVLHLICQAHLDPVWLWPWRDGFAEVLATLQSAVDRLREFPEMRYTCSSAAFYRWVQDTDPRLFRAIRECIVAGRWEVVGGWVVQGDTILPSEYSLHRQGQLAQAWFREHLGVAATVGYCVDSFGHAAGLPSILAAAGMRAYVFQRPQPHEYPDVPNLFQWEGPDGARVLTWRLACGYGQAPGSSADAMEETLRTDWHAALVPGMPLGTWLVGIGNHGGGPTRVQLERLCALQQADDPELPILRFSTLAEFFAAVQAHPDFGEVPVIRGELLHHARGCYTANSRFKRQYNRAEHALLSAERVLQIRHGVRPSITPVVPPPVGLREAWWTLCFNQFHDLLPGSSVPTAYEQAHDELGAVHHLARRLTVQAVHAQARQADTRGVPEGALFLLNTLPWAATGIVTVDTFVSPHDDSPITHLAAPDGERLPLQWTAADAGFGPFLKEWKKLVTVVPLPAGGTRWFELAHGAAPPTPVPIPLSPLVQSAAAKARLVVMEDRADTWGHDVERWDAVLGMAGVTREALLDDGPLFRRLRRWLVWGRSTVIVDCITWHPLGAIELVLHLNWQDRYQALKLELPLPAAQLLVHTPGDAVHRPLDGNEWPWRDWLLVAHDAQCLAVIGEGAAGYDATAERLRLTVLRCVPYAQHVPVPHPADSAQPFLDEGWQQVRYWLASPPSTDVDTLDRLAAELTTPLEHMLDSAHPSQEAIA